MTHTELRQRGPQIARLSRTARRGAAPASSPAIVRTVRAAARGDELAWRELVERYSGLVWSVTRAHRLGAADAADVVQTTWVKLVEQLDRLDNPSAVGAWLATTARRESLAVLRDRKRQQARDEVPEPASVADSAIDAALLTAERDALLRRALAMLPARDQSLLRLLATDPPPSYAEIGAAQAMPIGSIGPTRGRALERLRRAMFGLGWQAAD